MSVLDYAIRIIKATMKNHSNESFFPYFFIVGAGISVPERQDKVERAAQLARFIHLGKTLLLSEGGPRNV